MTFSINRYVFKEVAVPFFLGTFVLSFVALMPQVVRITEKVLAFGVSITGIGQVITYMLPPILLFVVPASFLLGVLVAFGRLSSDSEMIAIRAGGISLWQLLPAVLAIGLVASTLTGVMSAYGEPWGRRSIKMFLFNLGQTKAAGLVRERTFVDDFFGLVIYADSVSPQESKLENVFIADERDSKKGFAVVQAREGRIVADPESRSIILRLVDGTVDHINAQGGPVTRVTFARMDYNILPETTVNLPGKDPYEMYPIELRAHLMKQGDRATGREWMAYHKKFAYPFSALLMGLVGMALGISDPRHGKSRGYLYGLVAMLLYYLLARIGDATGERSVIDPFLAAWLPNVVFFLGGAYLFVARARERQTLVERIWGRIFS